jgi:hypothetical protein
VPPRKYILQKNDNVEDASTVPSRAYKRKAAHHMLLHLEFILVRDYKWKKSVENFDSKDIFHSNFVSSKRSADCRQKVRKFKI